MGNGFIFCSISQNVVFLAKKWCLDTYTNQNGLKLGIQGHWTILHKFCAWIFFSTFARRIPACWRQPVGPFSETAKNWPIWPRNLGIFALNQNSCTIFFLNVCWNMHTKFQVPRMYIIVPTLFFISKINILRKLPLKFKKGFWPGF